MTLEEAKKILEEEGFKLGAPGKPGVVSEDFAEYESPEICEAMQIVCSAGFQLAMLAGIFDERKERLKKEYEKNTKAPGPGEEQPKENSLKAATDAFILQANEIMRLKKKNAELLEAIDKMNEGNPALKESASKFNEALLGEQAKEIKRLGKEISKLNGIIHKKNLKIEELRKESSRHLRGKIKMFGENVDLEQMLKDKNAILADVAEELRLTKIREKNLTEVCQKYIKANGELKEKLADKVVDKIDAQALKSAESALAYKEKVIDKLTKENNDYKKCVEEFRNKIADMTIGKIDIQNIRLKEKDKEIKELNDKAKSVNEHRHKELAEKDEVIADLNHELKAKHKKYVWYKGAYDAAQQILNTIADYAAKHPDKKFSDQMVGVDIADEGGDQSATIVQCDNGIILSKEETEIVERCTKNGTELHYSEKDGLTYTNMYGEEIPIRCLRGLFHVFTDEELKNMKK